MAGDVIPLHFGAEEVRWVEGPDGPEAIAADVGRVLGISDIHASIRTLPENFKGRCTTPTLGGPQEVVTLKPPGLYRLIWRSRRPEAEVFSDWCAEKIHDLAVHGYTSIAGDRPVMHSELAPMLESVVRMEGAVERIEARLAAGRAPIPPALRAACREIGCAQAGPDCEAGRIEIHHLHQRVWKSDAQECIGLCPHHHRLWDQHFRETGELLKPGRAHAYREKLAESLRPASVTSRRRAQLEDAGQRRLL